jgi:hypothetical protein
MKRAQLEELLRRLAPLVGRGEVTMIGSQCIHAVTNDVPAEVVMSLEVDILLDSGDPAAERIDEELGVSSAYRAEHGVYVDPVTGSFPFLPEGWEHRVRTIDVGILKARCLDAHDLVLSKLAAGRLKDNEMVASLVAYKHVELSTLQERIQEVSDLHLRAILLARLQLVLESIPM